MAWEDPIHQSFLGPSWWCSQPLQKSHEPVAKAHLSLPLKDRDKLLKAHRLTDIQYMCILFWWESFGLLFAETKISFVILIPERCQTTPIHLKFLRALWLLCIHTWRQSPHLPFFTYPLAFLSLSFLRVGTQKGTLLQPLYWGFLFQKVRASVLSMNVFS